MTHTEHSPAAAQAVTAQAEDRLRDVDRTRAEMLRWLEQRMQLPHGYVMQLRETAADWEFVIKLAVLSEAAVTRAIVSTLHDDRLYEHFSQQSQASRLNLCVSLGILDKAEMRILDSLATTRNRFAHRVENLERSLADYVSQLHGQQLAELVNRLLVLEGKDQQKAENNFDWLPPLFRSLLFNAVVLPLISLAAKDEAAELERERRRWYAHRFPVSQGMSTLADLFPMGSSDQVDTPLALKAAEAEAGKK